MMILWAKPKKPKKEMRQMLLTLFTSMSHLCTPWKRGFQGVQKWNIGMAMVTHFSLVSHFISKPVIWFAVQIKRLLSIWNEILSWNRLMYADVWICYNRPGQFVRPMPIGCVRARKTSQTRPIFGACTFCLVEKKEPLIYKFSVE